MVRTADSTCCACAGVLQSEFLDVRRVPIMPKFVLPLDQQNVWESRRCGGDVRSALRAPVSSSSRVPLRAAACRAGCGSTLSLI